MGGQAKKKSTKSGMEKATPWSDAFSRTAKLPMAFTVKEAFKDPFIDAVGSLGLPQHHQGGLFSTWYWATPLLDGYVLINSTEGFPAGKLPSGYRVAGLRPLRLMCHLLNLTQPRKFASEDEVPEIQDLLAELERQQAEGTESISDDDRSMLFVSDVPELTILTFKLFGDAALPTVIPYHAKRGIPGSGEWGRAGFSILDEETFTSAGISLEVALLWKPIAGPHVTVGFVQQQRSIDEVQEWIDAGCTIGATSWLMECGLSLDRVKEWIAVGGYPTYLVQAEQRGITASQVRPFLEIGIEDGMALDLVENGVSVESTRALIDAVEPGQYDMPIVRLFALNRIDPATARRWMDLKIGSSLIDTGIRRGVRIEDVERLIEARKPEWDVRRFIEKSEV